MPLAVCDRYEAEVRDRRENSRESGKDQRCDGGDWKKGSKEPSGGHS